MNTIELLDVSLRDGGHRTNFHFKKNELQAILTSLDNSGIEYIEIGYRNGSIAPIENIGPAGLCEKDYLLFCTSLLKKAKTAVMAHPKNVTADDIKELRDCGVQLLRICVIKGDVEEACPLIDMGKQYGLATSVNFIHTSHYKEKELDEVLARVNPHKPDMIYFADSNGSLLPARVDQIYRKYSREYSIPLGFHAHDNLGLAQVNTLAAMNAGAHYIDASLAGMGKGIGNLRTEFFTAYLHAINIKKYRLAPVLMAANYVRKALGIGSEDIEMDEFIRGISDFSTAEMKKFKETTDTLNLL
ncbi:TPA: 4-hydroxy-2-oxovalerate aldolase [Legionella feeleii]